MKARAFTMAEVLITLGIIGIVAAMTLPAILETFGSVNGQKGNGLQHSK